MTQIFAEGKIGRGCCDAVRLLRVPVQPRVRSAVIRNLRASAKSTDDHIFVFGRAWLA